MVIPEQEQGEILFGSFPLILCFFYIKLNIFFCYSVKKDGLSNPETDATKNCTEGICICSRQYNE